MRVVAFALVSSLLGTHAAAQYAGNWQAGPLRIRHEVASWGSDCGPRPPATMSQPGGAVSVTQNGDHLRFSGAVQGATDACWSDKPGIRRLSSTFREPNWTTICRTREGDAQPENGRYTFRASGDTISYQETTTWNWRLRSSSCEATRRASRTFTRVGAASDPEPDPEPEPEPACTAGAPARVRISPSRETIEPGEQVCFRARVVDAQGCTVRGQRVQLELSAPDGQRGSLRGRCFTAGATAAEAEGVFRVIATSGSFRANAEVEVTTEDLSDLTARRIRESSMGDSLRDAEAEDASGLQARVLGQSGGVWIVGGILALLLIFGGAVLLVVRRRKPEPEEKPAAKPSDVPVAATATPPRRVCPVCGHEETGGDGYCPKDGAELVDPHDPTTRAQGMICPTCRRGYGAEAETCSHDGDELVPYSMFVIREKRASVEVKKICPKCGTTYDAETTFCGKDGSPLETVN